MMTATLSIDPADFLHERLAQDDAGRPSLAD
jgi:hypothetical protein